jgi:hypothetical protein
MLEFLNALMLVAGIMAGMLTALFTGLLFLVATMSYLAITPKVIGASMPSCAFLHAELTFEKKFALLGVFGIIVSTKWPFVYIIRKTLRTTYQFQQQLELDTPAQLRPPAQALLLVRSSHGYSLLLAREPVSGVEDR